MVMTLSVIGVSTLGDVAQSGDGYRDAGQVLAQEAIPQAALAAGQ